MSSCRPRVYRHPLEQYDFATAVRVFSWWWSAKAKDFYIDLHSILYFHLGNHGIEIHPKDHIYVQGCPLDILTCFGNGGCFGT